VELSAEVSGEPRDAKLSFEWSFGDGASGGGRVVSHRFTRPGVYEAVVTVYGTDDSGGASAPLRITVGEPPHGEGPAGGGTGRRDQAPAHGPASGKEGGATAGEAAGASESASPAAGKTPASKSTGPQGAARARQPTQPPSSGSGDRISGTLVALRTGAALPGSSEPVRAALGAVARRGTDTAATPLGAVLGIVAALGLLGLGGHREIRALR
jgi:PKD repeat protein